jgi:hypothetical protein
LAGPDPIALIRCSENDRLESPASRPAPRRQQSRRGGSLRRWPVTGSILTIPGALSFFGGLAVSEAIAGKRYHLFLAFLAVTIIPALLTLACCFARTHAMTNAKTPLA